MILEVLARDLKRRAALLDPLRRPPSVGCYQTTDVPNSCAFGDNAGLRQHLRTQRRLHLVQYLTIRLDKDVVEWYGDQVEAAGGGNYQTLVNQALRETMKRSQEPLEPTLRRDSGGTAARWVNPSGQANQQVRRLA